MAQIQKTIGACLIVIGLGGVASFMALTSQYANTLSRNARPDAGRTQPLNVHGTVVFLTEQEDRLLGMLFYGGMFIAALGGIATGKSPATPVKKGK